MDKRKAKIAIVAICFSLAAVVGLCRMAIVKWADAPLEPVQAVTEKAKAAVNPERNRVGTPSGQPEPKAPAQPKTFKFEDGTTAVGTKDDQKQEQTAQKPAALSREFLSR